eukprot:Skav220135  [mRNA]  locus=scaffold4510:84188:85781:- [translate_table: standard]
MLSVLKAQPLRGRSWPRGRFVVSRRRVSLAAEAVGCVRCLVPVLEMRERDGGLLERLELDENSLGPHLKALLFMATHGSMVKVHGSTNGVLY